MQDSKYTAESALPFASYPGIDDNQGAQTYPASERDMLNSDENDYIAGGKADMEAQTLHRAKEPDSYVSGATSASREVLGAGVVLEYALGSESVIIGGVRYPAPHSVIDRQNIRQSAEQFEQAFRSAHPDFNPVDHIDKT